MVNLCVAKLVQLRCLDDDCVHNLHDICCCVDPAVKINPGKDYVVCLSKREG